MKLLDELGFTNDKVPDGDSFSQDDGMYHDYLCYIL